MLKGCGASEGGDVVLVGPLWTLWSDLRSPSGRPGRFISGRCENWFMDTLSIPVLSC